MLSCANDGILRCPPAICVNADICLIYIFCQAQILLHFWISSRNILSILHLKFQDLSFFVVTQVATNPSGQQINALEQHIKNLLCPSTPFFFNTLYEPYREGADFVRGYPFSLREGVPTAVSHGLWLNIPDYDAPTQLVKPLERNTRYIYIVPYNIVIPLF